MENPPVTSYHDDPKVDELVNDTIGRVADKWTFLLIEALEDRTAKRFSQLAREVPGISQKMLTQTLRQMEREGLVSRTVFPEVPPRVEYALTDLGRGLAGELDRVIRWIEANSAEVEAARARFGE